MPPPCPSNNNNSNHNTITNFNLKPTSLITLDPPPVHLGLGTNSVHDDFESQGTQVQENHQPERGQAIILGQPLEEEGVIPGLGLFLGVPTHDAFRKKKDTSFSQSKMLNPSLESPGTQMTVASSSQSKSILMSIGLGGNTSVPNSGVGEPGLTQTRKMALLKEARDATLSMYKQKVNEAQWYASKVALLDMHYIKALQDNHDSGVDLRDAQE